MTRCEGFGPVVDAQCRVLVLGSMPGIASLEKHQYYGHPRNLFWPIMGELFGAHPSLDYSERLRHLLEHHVALWDVLKLCQRPGSLDADIVAGSEQVNDFHSLFGSGTAIRAKTTAATLATAGLSCPLGKARRRLRGCWRSFSISTRSFIR